MMKKYIAIILPVVLFGLLASCNDDADSAGTQTGDNEPVALSVKTNIATQLRSTKGTIDAFPDGSRLGLFVTHHGNIDNRYDMYGPAWNVISEYMNGYWHQIPQVMLGSHPVSVYAYYPHARYTDDPRQIPIEHTSQTDYLYSSPASNVQEVHKYHPDITLFMNHALALVQFNLSGMGNMVDYVEIANTRTDVTDLHSRGVMDISTGEITADVSSDDPVRWENDGSYLVGFQEGIKMLVMPTQLSTPGSITVTFNIDGEPCVWHVPPGTQWRSGTKNTYHMQIVGRELYVKEVIIEPWQQGVNESYPLD